jgi:hypothetical protein
VLVVIVVMMVVVVREAGRRLQRVVIRCLMLVWPS